MRRTSRTKSRKSEVNSDGEEEVSGSVKADNDETGSGNEVEASNSTGKKRNARGNVKANEENHTDDKEESEEQENGKPPSKKRKNNDESLDDSKVESDEEADKSINSKKKKGKQEKEVEENGEEEKKKADENGKSPSKSKKKGKAAKKVVEEEPDEEEYEVEKIVDQRTIKGRRQFLVRWKGYTEEHDTWEQEKELNCDRLIEEFLAEQEENNESFEKEEQEEEEKPEKKAKAKKQDKSKKQKRTSKAKNDVPKDVKEKGKDNEDDKADVDESIEYEVERIIEVHFKKDKNREFLIRWKGFSSKEDTWEPEENLNCPELINKFMEKLDKIKSTDSRELRVNRPPTKRYTLTMHGDKRQSRRNADKQRVTYHDCDD